MVKQIRTYMKLLTEWLELDESKNEKTALKMGAVKRTTNSGKVENRSNFR